VLLACVLPQMAWCGRPLDLVDHIPGFEDAFKLGLMFEVYSGYLDVDLTDTGLQYEALKIHYELHTCRYGGVKNCPVAVWHQGGPGGSAVFGAWTEMGPFKLMSQGPVTNFDNAWNNAATMLYLESPAGSTIADQGTGYSSCWIGGNKQDRCYWDDKSQAVAYKKTLDAFYEAFHEAASQDLYLVGESYAGQYVPNIASYLLDNPLASGVTVKGIALGNACWGGDEDTVLCNGEHEDQIDVALYHGKGLISESLYQSILDACGWSVPIGGFSSKSSSKSSSSLEQQQEHLQAHANATMTSSRTRRFEYAESCQALLDAADAAVGPFNVYNLYDDCDLHPPATSVLEARDTMPETDYAAGFPWTCESDPALDAYFARADVRAALHLTETGSGFSYTRSGPASILLYPTLLQHMRVLIYNGDADACVPYVGNEQWTTSMVDQGVAAEAEAWRPWYLLKDDRNYAPAGYVTTYSVPNKRYLNRAGGDDFAFLTVRLAGHMVPQYQPEAALAFFSRFLAGEPY